MPEQEQQHIEEQKLWAQFIEGDDHSLEKLYRRYFDDLYLYGRKWLNNTQLTEDSIQDLFIKLMKNRSSLSHATSVKFYLFRAFRSVVLDKLKVNSRMQLIDEPGEQIFIIELCPERKMVDEQEHQATREKLASAMLGLSPRQREAIFLRYMEGFSYAEVSEAMDITPKATYKLMARAIEALKELMVGSFILVVTGFFLKNLNFFSQVGVIWNF